ncbi:DNA repair protein XRCC3 [Phytophthora cinnamomi]|uniref:DNA repair protein XRCC3 n=1 Tax=Phytophthora cinnamomi TaxID=4785 RepID=UPI00355A5B60|nr:DNA repair protein XRCC3 [Phytophthora cinnamomi]
MAQVCARRCGAAAGVGGKRKRGAEVAKLSGGDFLNSIFVEMLYTVDLMDLLEPRLPGLLAEQNTKLAVLDSVAAVFRLESTSSVKYGVGFEVVTGDFDPRSNGNALLPALGHSWLHCVNQRLMITRQSDSNRRRLDAFPPHLPAENYVFHVTSDGVRPDGTCSQTLQIAGVRVDAAKVDKVAKRLHGVLLDLPRLCNVMLDPRWHAAQRPDAKSATIARAAGGVPVRRKLQLRAPRGSNRYFVLKTVFKARWGHGRTVHY